MIRREVRAERSLAERCIKLYGFQYDLARRESLVITSVVEELQPGCINEPMVRLEDDAAQSLMDDLWRVGFRPSEAGQSAGALSATERHLQDLRKLVDQVLPLALRK